MELILFYILKTHIIIRGVMKNYQKHEDYISNKQMYQEIIDCQKAGVISDKLARMFMLIAKRYATKPNFSGYTYKDEMISSGITSCVAAFPKFNGEKSENPFAYFTMVIHHAFIQILNKERKHHDIRDKLLIDQQLDPSFGYAERHRDDDIDHD